MNQTIWKFKFRLEFTTLGLRIPSGAKIIHVGLQGDCVCIWAEVDPNAAKDLRSFVVLPTGATFWDVTSGGKSLSNPPIERVHIGTLQTPTDPQIVFHVFEEVTKPRRRGVLSWFRF